MDVYQQLFESQQTTIEALQARIDELRRELANRRGPVADRRATARRSGKIVDFLQVVAAKKGPLAFVTLQATGRRVGDYVVEKVACSPNFSITELPVGSGAEFLLRDVPAAADVRKLIEAAESALNKKQIRTLTYESCTNGRREKRQATYIPGESGRFYIRVSPALN